MMNSHYQQRHKLLPFLAIFFIVILIISNIVSTKIIDIWRLTFDGGTILFPLSYILGDILTEVYGYKQSRKVIRIGFLSLILMAAMVMIIGILPSSSERTHQEAYDAILGFTPRIVCASLIAYIVGEFSNAYLLAKLKIRTKGKQLWIRTIGSTIIGEGFDTLLFVVIAFYGTLSTELLMTIIISNYLFKLGVEIVLTPLTYRSIRKIKKIEGTDIYDNHTNFNPLKFF